MPQKKKSTPISRLRGLKLYNKLLSQLTKQNAKDGKKQQLGIEARRRIVSQELYPKYKSGKGLSAKAIETSVAVVVKALPPREICNPLYLSPAYLEAVEYYDIDNRLRNLLPDCVEVKVNAGSFGKTKIFYTANYSYYGNGVQKIVERIREELEGNLSGFAYFSGIVKVKPGKSNDGKAESYFVDFILYINETTELDDEPAMFDLPKREVKKKEKIRDYMAERFSKLEKEKQKEKRKRKKASPQEYNKRIQAAINADRALLRSKVITKAEFQKRKQKLTSKKKKP